MSKSKRKSRKFKKTELSEQELTAVSGGSGIVRDLEKQITESRRERTQQMQRDLSSAGLHPMLSIKKD